MRRPQLVVVGNGMAGVRTIEELLRLAPQRYDITVFGAEPHPNYNRILLSPVLAGELNASDIVLNDLDWYWRHEVRVHLGRRVERIDRVRRVVVADDGTEVHYDRLLLATGSRPLVLPVPGARLGGVCTYRDLRDTGELIVAARRRRNAVVIGGGLLGLEAAHGLRARGMDVTVVHRMPWLMERQLNATAAGLLARALEARGVAFRLGAATVEIAGDGSGAVRALRLADGSALEADLVVMAVGIRPETALAEAAGLHCERGVVVSDTMQTYDPRIYAVGECAAHRGTVYGLLAPLYEMARVCATHLAGIGIGRYTGTVPATRLKVTGIDLYSAGDFEGGAGTQAIELTDSAGAIYRRAVLREGRLVGALLYGETSDAAWFTELIRSGADVTRWRDALLFGKAAASAGDEPACAAGTGSSAATGAELQAAHSPARERVAA
jgi:nitrite reductase (NADH) large subunit